MGKRGWIGGGRGVQVGAQSVNFGAGCGQLAHEFVQFRLFRGEFLKDGLFRAHHGHILIFGLREFEVR